MLSESSAYIEILPLSRGHNTPIEHSKIACNFASAEHDSEMPGINPFLVENE
jgi:hypothetical protein